MKEPADPKTIFLDALERDGAERAAFLDRACGADVALRARVAALLASHDLAGSFLASPTGATGASDPSHVPAGTMIGRYELQERLGEGGFGTVWKAEQNHPVRRQVAVKIAKRGMDTRSVVGRFEQERQALAMMDHPNIAKVFDGGETPAGHSYFVMELVREGVPITQFCDAKHLDATERMSLFVQVCHAVQHAHQKGIIHRDLKPSNVLVTLQDGAPVPKVIDFGIAKAVHGPLTASTLQTGLQQMVGTPEYMSPEQAEMSGRDIDTRSDIYSLGVLLYELLTGTLPFDARTAASKGMVELLRRICEEEPPKPSTRISTLGNSSAEVAIRRRTDARHLKRMLRGDLDWIVMKALEKDRGRRYVSADALAADIERHLHDEPVQASPPGRMYRLRKYVRRHRVGVTAATLVVAALVLGLSAAAWQASRANANQLQLAAKVHESDQLAALLMYDNVIAAERDLHPAWPSKVAAMERWLHEDCGRLLAMQPEIERTVNDLRARFPAATRDVERERRQHPRFAEWQALGDEVAALQRAQAVRAGATHLEIPTLPADVQGRSVRVLNELAWDRVAPTRDQRQIHGEEPYGLACAKAALAKCEGGEEPQEKHVVLDTLAWALFANGQDAHAARRSAEALEVAPAADQQFYRSLNEQLARSIAGAADALAAAQEEYETLTAALSQQRTSQQFLHNVLFTLLERLDDLRSNAKPSVEQRLYWASRIGEVTRNHPKARVTWAEARARIARADGVVAHELYRDRGIELRDEDVIGLVPIGMNPVTRLWEFYDLRSAWDGKGDPGAIAIPEHDRERGSIEVAEATGIVFVLLPGGTFTMGAQRSDPTLPNFDRYASAEEMVHEITLAPFFLARHEMTRAQWRRLTGEQGPFYFKEGRHTGDPAVIGPTHPAETIDWTEATQWLERHGMQLPTEAQWEYGCRAGRTKTPWWTGDLASTLQGAANVFDRSAKSRGLTLGTPEAFDDGFAAPSPVGTFEANAFGLFDTHGNVNEWCRDWLGSYSVSTRPGDALRRASSASGNRICRGGGYTSSAVEARSSQRSFGPPSSRFAYLGVRAARAARF